MLRHPRSDDLQDRMEAYTELAVEWNGCIFRSTTPQYASSTDLISGVGSRRKGARYTPVRSFSTVYGGEDPETALAETMAYYRDYGFSDADAMPRVFVNIEVEVYDVLDLTDAAMRRRLGVTVADLTEGSWRDFQEADREALTQAIGRTAYKLGFEGLFYPSARLRGRFNLAVFPENLYGTSSLRVDDVFD